MSADRIPLHQRGTIWRDLSDGVVLVSPGRGVVRVLNGVGAHIWRLMDGERTITGIQSALIERYEVSSDTLSNDLRTFLADLETRGLLEWKQAG